MKTVKFALIAAIVACTMVSLANADGFKGKPQPLRVVNVSIVKAVTVPGLAQAMVEQIDKDELLKSPLAAYVAYVSLNGITYRIYGTRNQWIRFFNLQGDLPWTGNPVVVHEN